MPLLPSFLTLALLTLLVVLAFQTYAWWLKVTYHEADASDEIHFVKTPDGARLALYRHRAQGNQQRGEPVFFCHGLGASKYNFDFDETYSWARMFAKAGFDAWVVDLRGAGLSTPPRKWDWCFDDYAKYDVTSCIQHIRQHTGAEKVHWVGHSMGGMLLYAYLGSFHPEYIRSGVTMGSPIRFAGKKGVGGMLNLKWILKHLPYIPIRSIVQMVLPFITLMPNNPIQRAQMNPKNVDLKVMKRVAYNAVYHLPLPLLRQFADWAENDCFRSEDLKVDYQAGVRTIHTPIMVMEGAGDRLVVNDNTRHAFDLLPEGDKKFVSLGTESGFSADYGHVDMVFGAKAHTEVFPLVLNWVAAHDTVKKPSGPVPV